jgi:hypothetical protein
MTVKPELIEQLIEAGEEPPEDPPPFQVGLLPGDGDRYIITDGPAKGMKGYFSRNADGEVDGLHVGGRQMTRIADAPA